MCSICAFAIGLACSNQETSLPFARSGSAVTAIFIFSTIFSVERLARRSEQHANSLYKKLTDDLTVTGRQAQKHIEETTAKNTELVIRINIFLSATGLCLATLVWGFGDLLAHSHVGFFLPFP